MPSELSSAVKNAISDILSKRMNEGDLAIDVLRSIRDDASLLMERQAILDTLDSDPFELCRDDPSLKKQIERVKNLMKVTSCSRCTTRDGFSTVDAVLEFERDKLMNEVENSLKLTFTYERKPIPHQVDESQSSNITDTIEICPDMSTKNLDKLSHGESVIQEQKKMEIIRNEHIKNREETGTHVTYSIFLARDYGPKEQLVSIEVIASGEGPSAEEAIPMEEDDDDEWEDISCVENEGGNDAIMLGNEGVNRDAMDDRSRDHQSMLTAKSKGPSIIPDGKDRFAAYVNPETLTNFVSWLQLNIDDVNSIYFLMSFMFYEHEWELVRFLMDCVFGEDGSDEEN